MKEHFYTTILCCFLSVISLISCNCEEMICEPLNPEFIGWANERVSDSQKFVNASGDRISFIVRTKQNSATSNYCKTDQFGGCLCNPCPPASITYQAQTADTSRAATIGAQRRYAISKSGSIQKLSTDSNLVRLHYEILGHNNSIEIGPQLKLINPGDTILPFFAIGGINYSNVIVHKADTSLPLVFAATSYYTREFGVIAFYDKKTQSTFYRVP